MSQRYWIGVIATDHADHAIKSGVCAFSNCSKSSLAKLSEGDRIAYYSPKTAYADVPRTPVRPLLEHLKFVVNPAKWGMAFRRGQFEISEVDFNLIETTARTIKK